ncbi:MAG: hypothetical protein MO846_06880 [Candidatus Devosia symbiotica]|nr:hypothetical protein [Candidatus Devosia symbiotica]
MVFLSHLSEDAARLADRAIVLDRRPARILADIAMPAPPAERGHATLTNYRAQLDQLSGLPDSGYA